ncbi:MAG TPA: Maf family protein [Bacteroidota bacterium]|nr:Maf family protein [Bacteroidota bacterium]
MIINRKFILASSSPRRRQLLSLLNLDFEVRESGADEESDLPDRPADHVSVLSARKAAAIAPSVGDAVVIGADTIVVLDGRIIGKPASEEDARRMLADLSGRTHEVFTGFTLVDRPSGRSVTEVERTSVKFRILERQEIEAYVASGSPMDKAGAYGIQDDFGAVFVERIDGCFYNVVGFPLTKFYLTLQKFLRLR